MHCHERASSVLLDNHGEIQSHSSHCSSSLGVLPAISLKQSNKFLFMHMQYRFSSTIIALKTKGFENKTWSTPSEVASDFSCTLKSESPVGIFFPFSCWVVQFSLMGKLNMEMKFWNTKKLSESNVIWVTKISLAFVLAESIQEIWKQTWGQSQFLGLCNSLIIHK